jgi:glycosyltransferase involved in cell wall biosynthesis
MRQRLPNARDFTGSLPPYHPLDCVYSSLRLSAEQGPLFFSPGYNAPLFLGGPFVFTIHDLIHIDLPQPRAQLKAAYYAHVIKPACRRAQRVVTVSEWSRQRIAEWSGIDIRKVVNVGNGVGQAFVSTGERYELGGPYVLCIGNRKPHKNELRALRAFARGTRKQRAKLLFLGAPTRELLDTARSAGIEDQVRFVGRVSDTMLATLYRGATGLLFPSLLEGFGLPVIEAMACGTPVITSTAAALPETAGDAALLVDPKSEEAIADAVERLIDDVGLRRQLSALGHENAKRFSWDLSAQRLVKALESVC